MIVPVLLLLLLSVHWYAIIRPGPLPPPPPLPLLLPPLRMFASALLLLLQRLLLLFCSVSFSANSGWLIDGRTMTDERTDERRNLLLQQQPQIRVDE